MTDDYREFRFASADGLQLFCREYGMAHAAHTVVCLPGLTRNSRDFAPLARRLAIRYRVLTPDLRGRGLSDRDPNGTHYQPPIYYGDVLRLLDTATNAPVAVIGTSLGGLLAMALAAGTPARIAGIVLNDIGPAIDPRGFARIGTYVGVGEAPSTWSAAMAQAKKNYALAYPDLDDAAWLAYAQASYRENERGELAADYDPAIGELVRAAHGALVEAWPVWAALGAKPVLAIRGAMSDILSRETFERMQREKPDLETFEVPNRGHVPLLDEPGVPERIEDFLARAMP